MEKMKLLNKLLPLAALMIGFVLPSQAANFQTNCLEAASPTTGYGCTANDASISDFRITWIGDGCVNSADRAEVKMSVTIAESTSKDTYNVGLFINTEGGSSAIGDNTTTTQCLHEALIPVGLITDPSSGIGPFLDRDGDTCGDITSTGGEWNRTIESSDTDNIFTVSCADSDGNGYVDFAWATAWGSDTCTQISDAVAGGKPKCGSGINDTFGTANSIAIGVPDMNTSITCTVDTTQTNVLNCTVSYINNSLVGPGNYLEFYVDYNSSQGTLSNISVPINTGNDNATPDTNVDDTVGRIRWTLDDGIDIEPGDSGSFTFDMNVTDFTADINISIMGVYNNGTIVTPQPSLYDEYILPLAEIGTLPVTIAYVYPQQSGSSLDVVFSTATEVGNVGFNIYAIKDYKWIKLNDELIPGALDSFEAQEYQMSIDIPEDVKIKKIGIAGVDVNGVEDRHGPFLIGHESGSKAKAIKVNWKKVNKQVKKDRKSRKAAKKAFRKATKVVLKDQVINLGVSDDAVYRVTHNELVLAGIDFSGQKAKNIAISFRGKGVARYIDGLSKKGKWTNASYIEFIGTAPKGSDKLYLSANQYQLSLANNLVIESKGIKAVTAKTIVFEENKRYGNLIPGNDPFYDSFFYAKGTKQGRLTRQFDLPKLGEGQSEITVYVSVISETNHHLLILLNGTEIANVTADGVQEWPIKITVDNDMLNEGSNNITLTAIGKSEAYDIYLYDKLVFTYDDQEPVPAKLPVISLIDKLNKKSIKPTKGTNYIIITHPLFMGATLEHYIKQRESEGWNIQLVNVEDIYATYGYGMAIPNAIKAYLKIAAKQGVTHVQLVGSASYDYHDYLGLGSISFIPSIYVKTNVVNYAPSDTLYVSNEAEIPQLAIGRWPVRTLEGLEAVVSKSLGWKSTGQSASHTALFIADKNGGSVNFAKQMEFIAQKFETSEQWNDINRVYMDDFIIESNGDMSTAVVSAREAIAHELNKGPSITSYSGHSSPEKWSYDGLLRQNDIASIQNYEKSTLALPLACYTTYADSPSVNTMAHQLLAEGENGAVAVYGAALFSAYSENGMIASKVIDYLFNGETIGEAILKAKNDLGINYRDTILNGALLGDVTLRLR